MEQAQQARDQVQEEVVELEEVREEAKWVDRVQVSVGTVSAPAAEQK